MSSMLAAYTATVEFITAEQNALGVHSDHVIKSVDNQFAKLKAMFLNMQPSMSDSTATMLAIGKETTAFSSDRRHELCKLVSDVSNGSVGSAAPAGKTQTHLYMYNYMMEETWSKLTNIEPTSADGMHALIEAGFLVGLRNPTEKSIKSMVALLATISKLEISPLQAFGLVQSYKKMLINMRDAIPGTRTMLVFPSEVGEFIRLYPDKFSSPPVPSRVDIKQVLVNSSKDKTPGRKSNLAIREDVPTRGQELGLALPRGMGSTEGFMGMLVQATARAVSEQFARQGRPPAGHIEIFPPDAHRGARAAAVHGVPRATTLPTLPDFAEAHGPPALVDAVADARIDPVRPPLGAPAAAPDVASIIEMEDKVMVALELKLKANADRKLKEQKATAIAKAKAAKKAEGVVAAAVGDDSDEGLVEPVPKKHKTSAVAVLKRPAKADPPAKKHPAGVRPPFGTSPREYMGGRIYYSEGRNCLRCYKRLGDKVELTISCASGKKLAWAKACSAIEDDPRKR